MNTTPSTLLALSRWRQRRASGRGRSRGAFTLIELLVVMGIIVLVLAIALPNLRGLREGQEMDSATRQLIADLSLARAKAISRHSTVAVVFVPSDILYLRPTSAQYSPAEIEQIRRLQGGVYTQYALFAFRQAGDQPGQNTARYLSEWKTLPERTFIAEDKFISLTDTTIAPFEYADFPFPSADSPPLALPYVAFDYEGRLVKADGTPLDTAQNIHIPLARGTILYTRNASGGVDPADWSVNEIPPRNSVTASNHIVLDWLTGRSHLERQEIQ